MQEDLRKAVEVEGQCQQGRTKKDKRNIINQVGVGKPTVWCLNEYQKQAHSDDRHWDYTCSRYYLRASLVAQWLRIHLPMQILLA